MIMSIYQKALPGGGGGMSRLLSVFACGGAARVTFAILRSTISQCRLMLRDERALRYLDSGVDKKLFMVVLGSYPRLWVYVYQDPGFRYSGPMNRVLLTTRKPGTTIPSIGLTRALTGIQRVGATASAYGLIRLQSTSYRM